MTEKTLAERGRLALEAFDRKSDANQRKAEAMVLVEPDGSGTVWTVSLWHGVTKRDTGERAGVQTFWASDDEADARAMARALAWWMRIALNLWGKPPEEGGA